jgi:preprotein translocase subunit SecE
MNRSLRRHPVKQAKGSKRAAAAPIRPLPRTGPGRAGTRHERRPFLTGLLGWRPRFLMDIIAELRKVTWPTRDDTVHLTIVVLIVTILLGAVLGAIDIGFGWLIDNTLLR